jgi:hypothetical protein
MRKWLVIALLGSLAAAARAADEAAPGAPVEAVAPAAAQEKAEVPRDPFWPIGYTPRADSPAPVATTRDEPKAGLQMSNLSPEQQAALSRKLKVTGIMKSRAGYTAFLNGRLVEAGDEIPVDFDGQSLTLVVRAIAENAVQIEPKP